MKTINFAHKRDMETSITVTSGGAPTTEDLKNFSDEIFDFLYERIPCRVYDLVLKRMLNDLLASEHYTPRLQQHILEIRRRLAELGVVL